MIIAWLILGGLAFEHAPHAEVGCLECHPSAASAVRLADVAPAKPCAGCHEDGRAAPPPRLRPPRLRFSHRAHLGRGAQCADCHPAARRPDKPRCARCHADLDAPERCADCHLSGPEGRLITEGPWGRLIPADHAAAGFLQGHHERPECGACHAHKDCLACHAGRLKPPSFHPSDYLALHGVDAEARRLECQTCHAPTECRDCHLKAGITDTPGAFDGRRQPRGAAYHPPGFIGAEGLAPGPSHHRHRARADLQRCVSCHTEDTCMRCHSAAPNNPLRVSPHPLDFKGYACPPINPRGCLKCHRSPQEVDRLCGR